MSKELILQFKDIDTYLKKEDIENNTRLELEIFKDYASKILFKELNENVFSDWWFCSGIELKNYLINNKHKKNKEDSIIVELNNINTFQENENNISDEVKEKIKRLKEFINEDNKDIFDNCFFSSKDIRNNSEIEKTTQDDEIDILFINQNITSLTKYFFIGRLSKF